jgi:hypothetical protein
MLLLLFYSNRLFERHLHHLLSFIPAAYFPPDIFYSFFRHCVDSKPSKLWWSWTRNRRLSCSRSWRRPSPPVSSKFRPPLGRSKIGGFCEPTPRCPSSVREIVKISMRKCPDFLLSRPVGVDRRAAVSGACRPDQSRESPTLSNTFLLIRIFLWCEVQSMIRFAPPPPKQSWKV